jgi:hypothetical protein
MTKEKNNAAPAITRDQLIQLLNEDLAAEFLFAGRWRLI